MRAYGTHPVFSGKAVQNITNCNIDEVIVTDTIPLTPVAAACDKIRVIELGSMLATCIKRVRNTESLSSLFI